MTSRKAFRSNFPAASPIDSPLSPKAAEEMMKEPWAKETLQNTAAASYNPSYGSYGIDGSVNMWQTPMSPAASPWRPAPRIPQSHAYPSEPTLSGFAPSHMPLPSMVDVVTTIFVVGFPFDLMEREFQNMFLFCPGFLGASLKMAPPEPPTSHPSTHVYDSPATGSTVHGDVRANEQQRTAAMTLAKMAGLYQESGPQRQSIGFARFETRAQAEMACQLLNGKVIDRTRGCQLKAEMAKKNLHIKELKSAHPSFAPPQAGGNHGHPPMSSFQPQQATISPHLPYHSSQSLVSSQSPSTLHMDRFAQNVPIANSLPPMSDFVGDESRSAYPSRAERAGDVPMLDDFYHRQEGGRPPQSSRFKTLPAQHMVAPFSHFKPTKKGQEKGVFADAFAEEEEEGAYFKRGEEKRPDTIRGASSGLHLHGVSSPWRSENEEMAERSDSLASSMTSDLSDATSPASFATRFSAPSAFARASRGQQARSTEEKGFSGIPDWSRPAKQSPMSRRATYPSPHHTSSPSLPNFAFGGEAKKKPSLASSSASEREIHDFYQEANREFDDLCMDVMRQ